MSPLTDSSNRKWTDAVIDGLPLKDGGQLQWTRYVRRRITGGLVVSPTQSRSTKMSNDFN